MSPIWLLTLAVAVIGANALLLSPIAAEVAQSFPGQDAVGVMLAAAVYGAAVAISALVLAPQADRFGLRRALISGLAALGVALCLCAIAPSLGFLAVAQALAGLAAGLCLPAAYGLAAEIAPPGRESETLGRVLTGWTLSLIAGVFLSAVLAEITTWRLVYGLLGLGALALTAGLRRMPRDAPRPVGQTPSPLRALKVPGIVPMLLSVACFMVAFYGSYAYLGPHLSVALGLGTAKAGLAALLYGIGFAGATPLDRMIDRFGAVRVAPVVFGLLVGMYALLAAAAGSAWALLALCVPWGAINHTGLNLQLGRLTALDPDRRGTILGLFSAVTYAAAAVGTGGFGLVYDSLGFAALGLLGSLCILPALAFAAADRRRRAVTP